MSSLSSSILNTVDASSSRKFNSGIGLKPEHFQAIIEQQPAIGFFEIHAENYMIEGGAFHHHLERIRRDYPLSIHGVALSIGAMGAASELDQSHLQRLKQLIDRYQPTWFSEHLAWSSHQDVFLNDLLPLPYTEATLQTVCDHIDQVQNVLQRNMLLENPSTYVEFSNSSMSETDFINQILQRTGCGLLLDVNNVYVSCTNHHRDPHAYLAALNHARVGEIHLAGFTQEHDSLGAPLLIDSHAAPVAQAVWQLYQECLSYTGSVATLIERDSDIPSLAILLGEAQQAQDLLNQAERGRSNMKTLVELKS
jgi:uncharacterized protein (UPF0276 family)